MFLSIFRHYKETWYAPRQDDDRNECQKQTSFYVIKLLRASACRANTQRAHNPPFPSLVPAIWSKYTNLSGPQCWPRIRTGQGNKEPKYRI
jgi:hypothetical protein